MSFWWVALAGVQPVVRAAEIEKVSAVSQVSDPVFQPFFEEISRRNPELEAARANWHSKMALVGPAGSLPDPSLTVGLYLQEVETRVGPQRARLGISQGFPWKGKLKLKGNMAAAGAKAARLRFEDLRNRLFSDFRKGVFQLLYLEQSIDVTGRHVELLREWESLMESRYTANTAKFPDWIRVEVELSRLKDRVNTLRAVREPVIEELNRILNRPSGSEFTTAPGMRLELPESIPYSRAELLKAVSSANPGLKVLDSRVRERKFAVHLSEKNFFPDFKVGVDFIQTGSARMDGVSGSGKDPVVLKFGFTLPLNRKKYRLLKMAASESFVEAEQKRVGQGNALASRLALLQFRYEDAVRKLRLYRDSLIVDTKDSLSVTIQAYESGDGGVLDIIDTERTLLTLELGMAQAKTDGLRALADMERITTLPLLSNRTIVPGKALSKTQLKTDKTNKEN